MKIVEGKAHGHSYEAGKVWLFPFDHAPLAHLIHADVVTSRRNKYENRNFICAQMRFTAAFMYPYSL